MERISIYLRKSRADLEAEAHGEGETLAKHKSYLLKYAKQNNLNIINIREEIVSGESLVHRPQMLELLKEVEQGLYDGVLVMDVDRLGRGNMQEQGLILETFKASKTKIITPRKVYDLHDEFDEEYSEFEAFMARKELKIITRRLQGGRVRSVDKGNYLGTRPPYGYLIKDLPDGRTLEPHPEQAPVVKMIYDLYTHDDPEKRMGSGKIANKLNELGFVSYSGIQWKNSSVLNIIKNAVYAGRIQWKKKETKKSKDPNKRRDTKTRPVEEWIDVEGKHESLISMETYQKAQKILNTKYHVPYQLENGITNPLAGLVRCGKCGTSMVFRPYGNREPHIVCYNKFCENKSSKFKFVESKILEGLMNWLHQYTIDLGERAITNDDSIVEVKRVALKVLDNELDELEKQKSRLHDFLERGIYDEATYLDRSQTLAERIETTRKAITKTEKELQEEIDKDVARKDIIPTVKHVLSYYNDTLDPSKQNNMLKRVLDKVVYIKDKTQRNDDFDIVLYPRIKP